MFRTPDSYASDSSTMCQARLFFHKEETANFSFSQIDSCEWRSHLYVRKYTLPNETTLRHSITDDIKQPSHEISHSSCPKGYNRHFFNSLHYLANTYPTLNIMLILLIVLQEAL